MLEQAVCREQRLPVGSSRSIQGTFPTPELLPAVSRMVALICHDLRLPLAAILANAEFLTESDISETERNEFYQEIRWSVVRMNELVSSLLECSKDREPLRPAARNIVDTVERAIRMACEAVSPDSGRVVITTTGNRCCLQIGVWDNGPGIPPTIQHSVFQPLVSYGKAQGSGLGLAIVKKIVEDHGGEIYLDGRSGTGTLFQITIPCAIPQRAVPLTPVRPIRSTRHSRGMARNVNTP
jgi:signal transduction histidine kinase